MLSALGMMALGVSMVLLARLSSRLGRVLLARPYYVGLLVGAVCLWIGAGARLFFLTPLVASLPVLYENSVYVLLAYGFPSLGVTLGLLTTWYYWSWLLAERN